MRAIWPMRALLVTCLPLALGFAGMAADPASIEMLKKTKACIGCDLRDADLTGIELVGAQLSGNVQLQGAKLGGADLSGADLRDANLTGAFISEKTSLSGADLSNAVLNDLILNFSDPSLSGATSCEQRALSKGKGPNFQDSNLTGASFRSADLRARN